MNKVKGPKPYERDPMDKGGKMKGAQPAKTKPIRTTSGKVVTGRAKKFC